MDIAVRKERHLVVFSVSGRMDAVTAPIFEKNIIDLISQGEKLFIMNFSKLEYISSAGLRSILVVAKKLKENQGNLLFAELQGHVEEVFKIAGFNSIFNVYETEKIAITKI